MCKGSMLKAIPPLSGIACLLSQGSLTVFNFFVTVHPYEAKINKCEDNQKKSKYDDDNNNNNVINNNFKIIFFSNSEIF